MKAGPEPATSTVEVLTKRIADATAQFGRIVKELGSNPQRAIVLGFTSAARPTPITRLYPRLAHPFRYALIR